ncbi:transcriptional regulator [Pseudomonas amygdali]|nr:transcriptional regulator [Pseudomonas amygdali]
MHLANLLALQRLEEPDTQILLEEVSPCARFQDLSDGRYNLSIAWTALTESGLATQPLWREELALAVPARSPLLAHAAITPQALQHYPVIQTESASNPHMEALLTQIDRSPQKTTSFELLAVLVAAGYGIGIAPRALIEQVRHWGITLRPFAGGPFVIQAQLHWPASKREPAADRFAKRAARIAAGSA